MTQLIFPSSPNDGQLYPNPALPNVAQFSWSSSRGAWLKVKTSRPYEGGGGGGETVGVIFAPTAPTTRDGGAPLTGGEFWYNTTTAMFFMYIDDGDSTQWVQLS